MADKSLWELAGLLEAPASEQYCAVCNDDESTRPGIIFINAFGTLICVGCLEEHLNELAGKVLPPAWLETFVNLSCKDKLVGIAVFAHLGGDVDMREAALATLRKMEGQ